MRKGIKKLLTVALTATLGLAALAGCGTGTSSNGDGSANGGTTKELSGKIQLAGSTSMEKMCGALMEAFMEEYPNVTVTTEYTGSGAGIESVTSGAVDIGNASRALSDKEKETEPKTGKSYPYIIRTKSEELFDPSDKNIITYGEKVFMASTGGNGLIEFTIELEYSSENRLRKPTSIVVVASSSRYGDFFAGSTGSTMWLDDLELIYE